MAEDYPATADRLIDDYVRFNPTRNRPLDMLPVLACLDRERTLAAVEDPHLTKPRPAFHYRMPNSLLDEPDWRVRASGTRGSSSSGWRTTRSRSNASPATACPRPILV